MMPRYWLRASRSAALVSASFGMHFLLPAGSDTLPLRPVSRTAAEPSWIMPGRPRSEADLALSARTMLAAALAGRRGAPAPSSRARRPPGGDLGGGRPEEKE